MFYVSQRVVCIRTDEMISAIGLTKRVFSNRLVVGAVYRIRLIEDLQIPGLPTALSFDELPYDATCKDNTPGGFPSTWFRPLSERKTDISVFEAMLKGQPVEV